MQLLEIFVIFSFYHLVNVNAGKHYMIGDKIIELEDSMEIENRINTDKLRYEVELSTNLTNN